MEKNALDKCIEQMLGDNISNPAALFMLAIQKSSKETAELQASIGLKCHYCGRTAKDLLEQNVFDPRIYEMDSDKPYCFLCSEHGMYSDVSHIEEKAKNGLKIVGNTRS